MFITTLDEARTYRSPLPHIRYGRILFDEKIIPGAHMGLYTMRFEPGGESTKHVHDTEVEVFFCLTGKGRTVVAGKEIALEPGKVVYIHPGEEHQTFCAGDEPLEMLCIFAPPPTDNPPREWEPVTE